MTVSLVLFLSERITAFCQTPFCSYFARFSFFYIISPYFETPPGLISLVLYFVLYLSFKNNCTRIRTETEVN